MQIARLHAAIEAAAPIDGVSVGLWHDRSTWRISFTEEATEAQRDAAQAVLEAFDPDAPVVPQSVAPYQARRALNAAGLREAAEAAIAGASQDVRDAWEYALVIERESSFIAAIGGALGLTDQQVDDLFIAAAEF